MSPPAPREDTRHHLDSLLMRESLLQKQASQSNRGAGLPHVT